MIVAVSHATCLSFSISICRCKLVIHIFHSPKRKGIFNRHKKNLRIARFAWNGTKTTTSPPIHSSEIVNEFLGLFERCEMSSSIMLTLKNQVWCPQPSIESGDVILLNGKPKLSTMHTCEGDWQSPLGSKKAQWVYLWEAWCPRFAGLLLCVRSICGQTQRALDGKTNRWTST